VADNDRPWYKDPPKLIPVIVGVTVIATFASALIKNLGPGPAKGRVEYVVDVSSAMQGRIGKKVKLPAVAAEVVQDARSRQDTETGLRLSGGLGCTDRYEKPSVDFSRDNGDAIESALGTARPGGRSDFASAVKYAANDVDSGSGVNTILIFVGGDDTCTRARSTAVIRQALRDLRATPNVDVDFKFVGIKVPPRVRRVLRAAKQQAEQLKFGASVIIARKPQQLANVVTPVGTPSPADTSQPTP
jgi:hypothetical protein